MSALDGFYSTWNKARATFGVGTPTDGSQHDGSSQLLKMKGMVDSALPDDRWQGPGSQAYAAANKEHAAVYEKLAALDRKMAAEITNAANIVTNGRTQLDTTKSWVDSAVDSLPKSLSAQARENSLIPIAKEGITQVNNTVSTANGDMLKIGFRVTDIKNQYDELQNQKLGPGGDKEDKGDTHMLGAEEDKEEGGDGTKTDMSSGDIETIDHANQALLAEMRAEYEQLPDGQIKTDRLADIAAIKEALTVEGSHLIYLEKPSDPSQMIPAATSVGDPFKADHVSVTVPGVGSTTRDAVAGMTREARDLRTEAMGIAEKVGESQNIATVAWVGYQPPLNLGQTSMLSDDLAQAGAPKLTSFLGQLDAASHNPGQTTALFGHSYGSLTSGIAMHDGASQYLDNAVLYGSPGFQADTPAELGMNDDNFFVMSAPDDPINTIGALAPVHGWGSDPNDVIREGNGELRYRFEHLQTAAGDTPIPNYESKGGASGHSEYPQNAGDRMTGYNLAAILLDRPDLTVKATPPTGRLTW
ncbi:alpha/beta hydrolase [Mycolicibacterium lutetiense]|uniref:Alpha/beta hydrolase n=1 Tax=Mycolicibacterium lutetiense TaxID=1641992 RepID=A0ABS4ZMK7_9MYCO|nr:alpha/beta hydrolase [Mycolicibacterium lutetiense]MBP2450732.1 hypothetical protein [Mycolicibacterium lutetiense]